MKVMVFAYGLGIIIAWLVVLTLIVYKIKKHYAKLIQRTKKTSIDDILETLLTKNTDFEANILALQKRVDDLDSDAKLHYQKIGFLRFNAFERGGGEQSFVVVLMDGANNGILLNFLHTHDGIRVYAKKITNGKSTEYELSEEEKAAIKSAQLL